GPTGSGGATARGAPGATAGRQPSAGARGLAAGAGTDRPGAGAQEAMNGEESGGTEGGPAATTSRSVLAHQPPGEGQGLLRRWHARGGGRMRLPWGGAHPATKTLPPKRSCGVPATPTGKSVFKSKETARFPGLLAC